MQHDRGGCGGRNSAEDLRCTVGGPGVVSLQSRSVLVVQAELLLVARPREVHSRRASTRFPSFEGMEFGHFGHVRISVSVWTSSALLRWTSWLPSLLAPRLVLQSTCAEPSPVRVRWVTPQRQHEPTRAKIFVWNIGNFIWQHLW